MRNNGGYQERGLRGSEESHERFLELCALSTTGELTAEEQQKLQAHLASCPECRQAVKEFQTVVDVGVPALAPQLAAPLLEESIPIAVAGEGTGVPAPAAPPPQALAAAGKPEPEPEPEPTSAPENSLAAPARAGLIFAWRNGHRSAQINWHYVWMPLAAAVVLTVTLGIYSYQLGKRHGVELTRLITSPEENRLEALARQMSDAEHDRQVLKAQLSERARRIDSLEQQIRAQSAALDRMKTAQANLELSLGSTQAEKQQLDEQRRTLAQKLDAAQAGLQKLQADLDSLQQQRSQNQLYAESLEQQIQGLHAQLRDRERTINQQDELLAHDRDIRDLMGARDLYIAEVYDVAGDGLTKKPYGRVFYTKGKSLIFYAYDLDQQPGVRTASTFQAWGRRGPDKQQALNLGIFYQDSVAKKRWVLKFNDPRALETIDAVFVTVEPKGGSQKPSGKALLFASLRIEPNHP